jgi:hypothetical protein
MEWQIAENAWPEDLFLLYPENREFLAGKSHHLSGNMPLVRLIGAFAITLIFGLLVGDPKGVVGAVLMSLDSQQVQGTIQQCYRVGSYPYVTFGFEVATGQYKGTSYTVEENRECSDSSVGSSVAVTYWPPDPSFARLTGSFHTNFSSVCLGTIILALLVVAPFEIWTERRKRYLARYGRLMPGKIVRSGPSWLSSERSMSVTYSFHSPNGRELTGEQSVLFSAHFGSSRKAQKNERTFPAAGRPVAVLYGDDSSFRML